MNATPLPPSVAKGEEVLAQVKTWAEKRNSLESRGNGKKIVVVGDRIGKEMDGYRITIVLGTKNARRMVTCSWTEHEIMKKHRTVRNLKNGVIADANRRIAADESD